MPSISVIVPVYRCEAYIAECIDSLLAQTLDDFEAVIVDDGTDDESMAIARQRIADDARFYYVAHPENQGLSAARNSGLAMASGTYVLFLDSDDVLEPFALEHLARAAFESALDLLDFNASIFYEPGAQARPEMEHHYATRPVPDGVSTGPALFCFYQQAHHYSSPACFRLIRRSMLAESGLAFKPGILHEDELFTPLLYAYAKRAAYLDEVLYRYRIRPGSLVGTGRGIRNASSLFEITQDLHTWIQAHAKDYDDAFIDALAQYLWVLRDTLAEDILACTGDELVAYQQTLTPEQRADFSEHGIQRAAALEQLRSSRTWKAANTLGRMAHLATRLARK